MEDYSLYFLTTFSQESFYTYQHILWIHRHRIFNRIKCLQETYNSVLPFTIQHFQTIQINKRTVNLVLFWALYYQYSSQIQSRVYSSFNEKLKTHNIRECITSKKQFKKLACKPLFCAHTKTDIQISQFTVHWIRENIIILN